MFRDPAHDAAKCRLRVKICGITNAADARVAADCGADAIGINLYRGSRRFVDLAGAQEWLAGVSEQVSVVAVMVNPTWDEALSAYASPFVDALQLHGEESPEFCRKLAAEGVAFAKALPVSNAQSLACSDEYCTQTLVLDSVSGGAFGGTGETFPWGFAAEFVAQNPTIRVVLAGGLTPENVASAIAEVKPFAVDVTSGVERAAGLKDRDRVRAFIAAAREV